MLKAYIGTTAILLAAVSFLFWQNNSKNEELGEVHAQLKAANEAHKKEVDRLNAALVTQKLVADQLEAEIAELDHLLTENRKAQNEIAKRNDNLKKQLKDLKDAKPEVKDYLDQPVPDDIARLFLKPSGATSPGDKDKAPSKVIDDGDGSSMDHRGNDQTQAEKSGASGSLPRYTSKPSELQHRQSRSQEVEIQSRESSVSGLSASGIDVLITGSDDFFSLHHSSSPFLMETASVKSARQLQKRVFETISPEHSDEKDWPSFAENRPQILKLNRGESLCFTV